MGRGSKAVKKVRPVYDVTDVRDTPELRLCVGSFVAQWDEISERRNIRTDGWMEAVAVFWETQLKRLARSMSFDEEEKCFHGVVRFSDDGIKVYAFFRLSRAAGRYKDVYNCNKRLKVAGYELVSVLRKARGKVRAEAEAVWQAEIAGMVEAGGVEVGDAKIYDCLFDAREVAKEANRVRLVKNKQLLERRQLILLGRRNELDILKRRLRLARM